MTEQQTPHIPDYAALLRRAAANHAADATRLAGQEQTITTELGRFETWMHTEHARIQTELEEAQAKADAQFRALSEDWEARKRDLGEVGRQKAEHQRHASGAERSWRNWCHDEGLDPDALPPLHLGTGPVSDAALAAGAQAARPGPGVDESQLLDLREARRHPTAPDPEVTRGDVQLPAPGGEGPQGRFQGDPRA